MLPASVANHRGDDYNECINNWLKWVDKLIGIVCVNCHCIYVSCSWIGFVSAHVVTLCVWRQIITCVCVINYIALNSLV